VIDLQRLLGLAASVLIAVAPTTGSQLPTVQQHVLDEPARLDELARAETRWKTSKITTYEFRFQFACGMIPPPPPGVPPILIRVNGESSTLVRPGADPLPVPGGYVPSSTVEKLFAFIREAWTKRPYSVEASYDEARGFPIRVCVDPVLNVTDDEYGFLITSFKVLSN